MAAKRSTSAESGAAGEEESVGRGAAGAEVPEGAAGRSGQAPRPEPTSEVVPPLEERYKVLFEWADHVILMIDAHGGIREVNPQGEKLSGYTREELLRSNLLQDLIVPENRDRMSAVLQGLRAGEKQVYEVRWRAKDGTLIAFEGSSCPHFSPQGQFVSACCILHNVTGRRHVEEALRLTQFSVDHAGDAVFWVGPEARLIYANRAACRRLGYSPEELLSMTVHDFDPNFPAEAWPDHWEELKRRGTFTFESVHQAKDGRIFPVELTVNYLEFGGQQYNCAFARDITERKQAEEALRKAYGELEMRVEQRTAELARSNADLQQFAYCASHDLQEPLRMMGAYLQALEQDSRDKLDGHTRDFIHLSLSTATRMQQLIDDLLAYAHVGARAEQLESVDVNAVVDQVIADLGETIRREGAVVTRGQLPTIAADRTLLAQLFQNLIGNAIKFHGEQAPSVHVAARQSDQEWVFSVQDNGIGIDANDRSRIFAVFERLHASDTYPGTGIGLAICKRVVERHMGRIWCESEPGQGTTFFFSIPQ